MSSAVQGASALVLSETSTVLQTAAAGTGNGTTLTLDAKSVSVTLVVQGASTPSLTLAVEMTRDGSTWLAAYPQDLVNVALAFVTSVAVGSTAEQRYLFTPLPGTVGLRVRVSAVVTGNVTVTAILRKWA